VPRHQPSRRPQLSPERLVTAALDVLQAEGFDGLTMRRVAAQLGVQAASLYNHVRNKDELLMLVADAICAEIPPPVPGLGWRDQLQRGGHAIRRVLLAHRDGARVLAATPPSGPHRLRAIEDLLRVLDEAGFRASEVADVSFVLSSTVIGFVLDESMGAQVLPGSPAEQRDGARRWFQSLPADRYPTFVRLADAFADSSAERRFDLAIKALLDGLELRLQPPAS
jgi:TetR/AcrR family tetracycline transcriptional repressor